MSARDVALCYDELHRWTARDRDFQAFSGLMKPRAEGDLDAAFTDLSAQAGDKASAGFARLSEAELGGLHLERLHRRGSIRYTMLVFEQPC